MLSGARGFQILARRLGVELSQAQFNDISKSINLNNRTVTFQTDGTPQDRTAVRF